MLVAARDEVSRHYFDPTFHGVDLNAEFADYNRKLDTARSLNEGFAAIAGFLGSLDDSHTYFDRPRRVDRADAGFAMSVIGDRVFVSHVRPGSDAEKKLHPGDQVIRYDGQPIARANFDVLQYYFSYLATVPATDLDLRSVDGSLRHERVNSRMIQGRAFEDTRQGQWSDAWRAQHEGHNLRAAQKISVMQHDTIAVVRLPSFEMDESTVDSLLHRFSKSSALVLDLRGNPGGDENTLLYFLSKFFDHSVNVATVKSRKSSRQLTAHGHSWSVYNGKVIVLVNAETASAAEVFARVMQLEKRGTVIGDRSLGAVREAEYFPEEILGIGDVYYGVTVSTADFIMSDGKPLERVGVVPEKVVLPTPQDIRDGSDPALAEALAAAGWQIDASAAGKIFPLKWVEVDTD